MTEPTAFSVYRGQSRTGIGEGPNVPVSHGEQYLLGTDASLRDGELLQAIRPWLSLDSDPGDHQRLKEQLEAWSCFPVAFRGGDWLFVARLVSAGIYDRRAAYFSHARAWRLADCPGPVDPGAYLGCSRVFDGPAQAGASQGELDSLPPAALPVSWLPSVSAEPEAARSFLGHLLQALELDYPLVVAAPVREFTPGSALFQLLTFARAALPLDLRRRCAIRMYTRHPQRFLRQLGANLMVLPDDSAGDALAARRDATLLDRNGRVKAGRRLEPRAEAYADVVLAGFPQEPRGLLPFGAQLRARGLGGRPLGEDRRLLQLVYNLAGALTVASGERDFDYLFRHLLRAQARTSAGLPWAELLQPADWLRFPAATLGEFLLEPPAGLATGERELQAAIVRLMGGTTAGLDQAFADWWRDDDAGKRARLLDLLAAAPALFSPSAVGTRTAAVPLERWLGLGRLHGLLAAELKAGVLGRRAGETAALAEAAADPGTLRVLLEAADARCLPPDWLGAFAERAGDQAAGPSLPGLVREILGKPRDWTLWGPAVEPLLDLLREQPRLPEDLAPVIKGLGEGLDFREHWGLYLRLADLLARADPESSARPPGNALMARLWRDLAAIDRPEHRAQLVDIALNGRWAALAPRWLVSAEGAPAIPWWRETVEPLLASEEVPGLMSAQALLALLAEARPAPSAAGMRRAYRALTAHWRRERDGTTAVLVRERAWLGWRLEAENQLTPKEKREAAMAWLRCPAWREAGGSEPGLESFEQALKDLAKLSGREMGRLCRPEGRPEPGWPRIRNFGDVQIAGLSGLAVDLAALAELAESVRAGSGKGMEECLRFVFENSRFRAAPQGFAALGWLLEYPPDDEPLSLEASFWLWTQAGQRQAAAVRARISSVLAHLDPGDPASLNAADQPDLWRLPEFLSGLAEWVCRNARFDAALLRRLERQMAPQGPERRPSSPERRTQAKWMADHGYRNLAAWLDPEHYRNLSQRALAALQAHRPDDSVWKEIAEWREPPRDGNRVSPMAGEPPLAELARINRRSRELSAQPHFGDLLAAARGHRALLRPVATPAGIRLPAFELALSLYEGDLGNIASIFLKRIESDFPKELANPDWWRGLLGSTRQLPGSDSRHEELLLNRIVGFANQKSDPPWLGALAAALRAEGKTDHARQLRLLWSFSPRDFK